MNYFRFASCVTILVFASCQEKKSPETQIPAARSVSSSSKLVLHPKLVSFTKHLETQGEYFQVKNIKGSQEVLAELVDKLLEALPKDKVGDLGGISTVDGLKASGLDHIIAEGHSSSYQDAFWHNRSFYATDGQHEGVLSLLGKGAKPFIAPTFAPTNTDFLFETQLNLKEAYALSQSLAKIFGKEVEQSFTEAMQQKLLGASMTTGQLFGKLDARLSIALTSDASKKWRSDPDIPELPTFDLVMRIDGVTWIWDEYGEVIEADSKVREEGKKKYITPGDTVPTPMGDLTPVIVIDYENNHIWVALHEKTLEKCLDDSPKLAQSKNFKDATLCLPEQGNALSYVSQNFCEAMMEIFSTAISENGVPVTDFIREMKSYLAKSKSGYAWSLVTQPDGILITANAPISNKENDKLVPLTMFLGTTSVLFTGAKIYEGGADRATCILNIHNIHQAIRADQHLNNKKIGDPIDQDEIFGVDKYLKRPVCPLGHEYKISETIPEIGTAAATCEHPDHHPPHTEGW